MFVIQGLTRWLVDIVMKFPLAVRPGLFVALALLLGWIAMRRGRSAWRLCVRLTCAVADLAVGLVLLAEYHWTQSRRQQGRPAATAAIIGGKAADRILDYAARGYERPMPVQTGGHWRTPILWGLFFCGTSILLYKLKLHLPPSAPSQLAAHVWHYWVSLKSWAHGG